MSEFRNPHPKPSSWTAKVTGFKHVDVSENSRFSTQIIHFNRFSIINQPFWGIYPYFGKHPCGTNEDQSTQLFKPPRGMDTSSDVFFTSAKKKKRSFLKRASKKKTLK